MEEFYPAAGRIEKVDFRQRTRQPDNTSVDCADDHRMGVIVPNNKDIGDSDRHHRGHGDEDSLQVSVGHGRYFEFELIPMVHDRSPVKDSSLSFEKYLQFYQTPLL